ncbi:Cytochrome P450 7B1 [Tulasnella sp. 419]|nr:Cytochrome P450 7B1 [Tulasnella sp. 419]
MASETALSWLTKSQKVGGYTIGPPAALAVAVVALVLGTIQLSHSSREPNAPPVVSSWIPYLGSADALDRDPDAFIEAAKKKYPGGVFGVKIAGRIYYYVTDVKIINTVYKQPKIFSMSAIGFYWAKWVFDVSDKALFGSNVYPVLGQHLHGFFAPMQVGPFVDSFAAELHSVIHGTKEIEPLAPGASISTPLLKFMYKVAYTATGRTLFGPTWDNSDKAMATFDAFDSEVYKAAGGYPPAMMRNFRKGREEFKNIIKEYLSKPHQPSQWIAERLEIAKDGGWEGVDLITLILGSWWPTMGNIPFSAYWILALALQHPDGVQPIIDELDAVGSRFMSQHPELEGSYSDHLAAFFQSNPAIPLLSSTISETLRFTTDTYSMRDVIEDEAQLGHYTVKKGDMVVCVTRGVHMDETEFGDNAKEWVPRRFMRNAPLDEDRKGSSRTEAQFNWMPFGGGISMCSGRHFAQYHMKITIATLLKTFRFELDRSRSNVKLGRHNRGFGIRRPEGDVMVKITRL